MENYETLLNRLDNALIEKELLNDEIKDQAEEINAKRVEIVTLENRVQELKKARKMYVSKIKGLNELIEDQAKEIEELHAMNWNMSKLLNKEIQKYNLKEYNINLGDKGGENA